MVRRMVGPDRITATALAVEVGVPQPTLSRWLREAATVSSMVTDDNKKPAEAPRRRPQDWTAEEKLRAVLDASGLDEQELGAFLRRNGLHEAGDWSRPGAVALNPDSPSSSETAFQRTA